MKVVIIVSMAMVSACLLFSPVQAADLAVTPATVALHFAGGSSINRSIVVDWSGSIVTAARIFTNITPNATGLTVRYNIPIWDNYFFLQPRHQNISMTITANPALKPGNYTITTSIESMTEIIIRNNTVTVTDPWLQGQYGQLNADRNSLQENLSILFSRYTKIQKDFDDANLAYQRERQSWDAFRALLIILAIFTVIGIALVLRRRKNQPAPSEMTPDGVRPIEEQPMTIVRRQRPVARRHR
jgi:hypothetical protein